MRSAYRLSRVAAAAGHQLRLGSAAVAAHRNCFLNAAVQSPPEAIAIESDSQQVSYGELLSRVAAAAKTLSSMQLSPGSRVVLLAAPGPSFVVALYACWHLGLAVVPLCSSHTAKEQQYYAQDSGSKVLLHDSASQARAAELKELCGDLRCVAVPTSGGAALSGAGQEAADALFVYTSGTTGKPKGAVHTHASVQNQCEVLLDAWGWRADDRALHVLPLHHMHGLVNILLCALLCGARVIFQKFSAAGTHARLAAGDVTVFMAVPTIYAKLIEYHRKQGVSQKEAWRRVVSGLRLMVSGSAALPRAVLEEWEEASGHRLLERYGMTELGMILSQPYHGKRITGSVGSPLPGVEVKLVAASGDEAQVPADSPFAETGELLVRSRSVFRCYWGKEQATSDSFDQSGYFKTGDVVGRLKDPADQYCILGRASVDIIKSAGYKLSALEIESAILRCSAVGECAVVGLADPTYGEVVAAVVVPAAGVSDADCLKAVEQHVKGEMAPYKRPRQYKLVEAVPRNAMGKVNKKDLRRKMWG
eukprot:TRINITY_DN26037_c0_g1_i1.p1 TRINITY_DN26037_c0_g1~~TRINITY_DN26037_c0_g1_i1.p1  ORF type:complete len:533 (+),score=58.96 TRINITY_DN26037_c0_g1_i1:72-1670(+)